MTAHRRVPRTIYTQKSDGDVTVVPLVGDTHKMKIACCDCGLVHLFVFAVVTHKHKRRVAFSAWRDARATAQRRRTRNHRGVPSSVVLAVDPSTTKKTAATS